MYEDFYGFTEKPFQIIPNPAYLFPAARHRDALTFLEYGISERTGFILLTGDIGTGKTTLLRHVLNGLDADIEAAEIFNTNVTSDDLIRLIVQEFELSPAASKAENLDRLYGALIDRHAAGRRSLLIIDEAQNLSQEALEEVRMLFNLQSDDHLLLQIVLSGQPELRRSLESPRLAQLRQRIGLAFHLTSLTAHETTEYIASRLTRAGGSAELFTAAAAEAIHQAAGGVPRTINMLCDTALVFGYADGLERIDEPTVRDVIGQQYGLLPAAAAGPETALAVKDEDTETAPPAGADDRLHRLEQRLHTLEALIADLPHRQTEIRLAAAEQLTIALQGQLREERATCEALHRENERLAQRCAELKGEHPDPRRQAPHLEKTAVADHKVARREGDRQQEGLRGPLPFRLLRWLKAFS